MIEDGYELESVYIVPQLSDIEHRADCSTHSRLYKYDTGVEWGLSVPLISAAMDTVTGYTLAYNLFLAGGMGIVPRFGKTLAERGNEVKTLEGMCAMAIGLEDYLGTLKQVLGPFTTPTMFVMDVAHAGLRRVLDKTETIKEYFPDTPLLVGASANPEVTHRLFESGADIVAVGVGPGYACRTRTITGVGFPQFTALQQSAFVARSFGRTIVCDGGVHTPGDFCKAIAAGASAVIMGKVFAHAREAAGTVINYDGSPKRIYRGMASTEIRESAAPEGTATLVDVNTDVVSIVQKYKTALQSAMSYSNSRTIEEFHERARFVWRR